MGNPEQIQGPVWHLPVNVYVTGLTGVPFFRSCLKNLAVNLSSGFSYIKPSFSFKNELFPSALLLIITDFSVYSLFILSGYTFYTPDFLLSYPSVF